MVYSAYKNKEARRAYLTRYQRDWRKRHGYKTGYVAKTRVWAKTYRDNLRKKAMDVIGGQICVNCDCPVFKILEINHKNGGGVKQLRGEYKGRTMQFHRDIISGKLPRKDFDVRCRVCNAEHYVRELLGVKGFKITFTL